MTVPELIDRLKKLPAETKAMYFHNVHGVISIDEINRRECSAPDGKKFDIIVLTGIKGDEE